MSSNAFTGKGKGSTKGSSGTAQSQPIPGTAHDLNPEQITMFPEESDRASTAMDHTIYDFGGDGFLDVQRVP